ncbi:MAG: flagellar biosynthesis protein FlhF [Deltaproteobacteria bacterium]|jgi:flagellar biosynthesis protein FlhF|nr:flagellar biosynthesis protein FlhF [Deltaproteobacteria bacterium]
MQIKRFEAKNMTVALSMIKAEMGTDAVILSARSIKKRSGILGELRHAGVEVTAATDAHVYHVDRRGRARQGSTEDRPADAYSRVAQNGVAGASNHAQEYQTLPKMSSPKRAPDVVSTKRYLFGLYQQLTSKGVDADIAADLTEGIKLIPDAAERLADGESEPLLAAVLEHMGLSTDAIRLDSTRPRAIAFVGATGVGKTTAVAKIAAHFAVRRKKAVALITFDDARIGALEQIRVYARIIGIPLTVATNRRELKKHLRRFRDKDLVLIDTPGLNPKNDSQIKKLQNSFEKLPAVQTQVVLSATTKEVDLMETLKRFDGFGQRRLLFTRLDETGTVGNLLNVLIRTNIPMSYISDGQQIPDDIRPASLINLVRILVHDKAASRMQANFVPDSGAAKHPDRSVNRSDQSEGPAFVAKQNSFVYHVTGCKGTKKIRHEQMVAFESAADAEQRNYLPCRICNPDRNMQPDINAFEGNHHPKVNVSTY